MTRRRAAFVLAALVALVEPHPALAHTAVPGLGGFYGGLLHPVLVPAHALALLGLGLWLGQQDARDRFAFLMIFAAALIAGIGAVVAAFAFEDAEIGVLATAGVAGVLVAVARPVVRLVSAALAVMLGIALALDSVPEQISMRASLIELAGTAIGAWIALMAVASLGAAARRPWQRIGIRILGSWTGAAAIFVLALRFARS